MLVRACSVLYSCCFGGKFLRCVLMRDPLQIRSRIRSKFWKKQKNKGNHSFCGRALWGGFKKGARLFFSVIYIVQSELSTHAKKNDEILSDLSIFSLQYNHLRSEQEQTNKKWKMVIKHLQRKDAGQKLIEKPDLGQNKEGADCNVLGIPLLYRLIMVQS